MEFMDFIKALSKKIYDFTDKEVGIDNINALTKPCYYIQVIDYKNEFFANYKKRSSAERLQVAGVIKGELISTLLPVMDNFERALNVPQEKQSEEVRPFIEGYEMIYKQLAGVLEKAGVRKIEALDKPFDPNYHQAVMRVPAEGVANDTIVEVLQDGYLLGDKTLRPAMVKVAFNG